MGPQTPDEFAGFSRRKEPLIDYIPKPKIGAIAWNCLVTVNGRYDGPVDQVPVFTEAHRDNGFYVEDIDEVVIRSVIERSIVFEGQSDEHGDRVLGLFGQIMYSMGMLSFSPSGICQGEKTKRQYCDEQKFAP